MQKSKLFVGFAALALILAGCSGDEEKPSSSTSGNPTTSDTSAPAGTSNTGPLVTSNTAPGVTSNTSVTPSPTSAGTSVTPTPTSAGTSVVPPVTYYTITWVVEGVNTNVQVAEGQTPVYTGTPEKASTAQYSYSFSGWDPAVVPAAANATYTAQFTPSTRSYQVTFLDEDEEYVLKQTDVAYGSMPVAPADPTKGQTQEEVFTFDGWDHELEAVHGEQTYIATYASAPRHYDITWNNYDGTFIKKTSVAYGSVPVFDGEDPVKPKSDTQVFTFDGWEEELVAVTGEATYTAKFTASPRVKHTISIVDADLTTLYSQQIDQGEIADYSSVVFDYDDNPSDNMKYVFVGLSTPMQPATANRNYIATYMKLELIESPSAHYVVAGLTCSSFHDTLTIPATYDDIPVTEIYYMAFSCLTIDEVIIGSNISYIGVSAFEGVVLESITIPSNVTLIDDYAFKDAIALKEIEFEEGLEQIRREVFRNTDVSELVLPQSLTIVGYRSFSANKYLYRLTMKATNFVDYDATDTYNEVFDDCGMLTEVLMPNATDSTDYDFGYSYYPLVKLTGENVANVGTFTFGKVDEENHKVANIYYTAKGDSTVFLAGCLQDDLDYRIIETGLATEVKAYAFYGEHNFNEIIIGGDVTSLGQYCFYENAHASSVTFEDGTAYLYMGWGSFDYCSNLVTVDMSPRKISSIPGYCFNACTKLASVTLSESTMYIYGFAFDGTALTSFHVTKALMSIDGDAFRGTIKLAEFTVDSENTAFTAIDDVLFTKNEQELVLFPAMKECLENTYQVPENTKKIRTCAFTNTDSVTRVDLPSTLTHLYEFAFYRSSKITTVTYPGTKAEFEALSLNYRWAYSVGFTQVSCSDEPSTQGIMNQSFSKPKFRPVCPRD